MFGVSALYHKSMMGYKSTEITALKQSIVKKNKELADIQDRLTRTEIGRRRGHQEIDAANVLIDDLKSEMASLKRMQEYEILRAKNQGILEGLETTNVSNKTEAVFTPSRESTASIQPTTQTRQYKWWRPLDPETALRTVRQNAKEKWPENYDMQLHEIDKQMIAYRELVKLNKDYKTITKKLLALATEKWGDNYDMALYEVGKQARALQNLK